MSRRRFIFTIVAYAVIAIVVVIGSYEALYAIPRKKAEQKRVSEEQIFIRKKNNYAAAMQFNYYWKNHESRKFYFADAYRGDKLIETKFVNSEYQNNGSGDSVIVVWPSDDTARTVYNLNQYVTEHNIDLSHYSLSYPITMKDVLEKWENVEELAFSDTPGLPRFDFDLDNAKQAQNDDSAIAIAYRTFVYKYRLRLAIDINAPQKLTAGSYTQAVIDLLNKYVNDHQINLSDYGLAGPVTVDDALHKPDNVRRLIDFIYDSDPIGAQAIRADV